MSEPVRGTRQFAEVAFSKTQARNRALEEQDSALAERNEKTQRLKEARLARDELARETAQGDEPQKRPPS